MSNLFLFFVVIHAAVGELTTIKSFTSFLDHAHLVKDASELGIIGEKINEDGLYSPNEEHENDSKDVQMQYKRGPSKLRSLPLEIYKGTDDENAYFITLREICDDKIFSDENSKNENSQSAMSMPINTPVKLEQPVNNEPRLAEPPNQQNVYDVNGNYVGEGNSEQLIPVPEGTSSNNLLAQTNNRNTPYDSRQQSINDHNVVNLPYVRQNADGSYGDVPQPDYKVPLNRANSEWKNSPETPVNGLYNHQDNSKVFSENMNEEQHNDMPVQRHPQLANEYPQLGVPVDDGSVVSNKGQSKSPVDELGVENEMFNSVPSVSVENDDNADAKKYIKDKISKQIQEKEREILGRLSSRTQTSQVEKSNSSRYNPLRRARSIEPMDSSLTYTEHERSMKQEVEVTYKRAQDIAKAILKTSEAMSNSLDLCKKPVSTNFLSDEPLTEAEDIIEQIVGQLKESLQLTMGCRTCVKPHKDLMLFLRWLVFDDVSIKLCPSKPKAADLRRNYLLFHHDNMFLGRVCETQEYPKAPINCSVSGEVGKKQKRDDAKAMKDSNVPQDTHAKHRHGPNREDGQ